MSFQVIFRLFSRRLNLNYNNLKSQASTYTKSLNNNTKTLKKHHSNVTPPPAYATLFNRNKIFTTNDYIKSHETNAGGKTQVINGRDYMVFQNEDGSTRLIPIRTPSATLFEYAYNR